jgi:molybdopterin converting factor small subunit
VVSVVIGSSNSSRDRPSGASDALFSELAQQYFSQGTRFHVWPYVYDDEDVRYLGSSETEVGEGDTVSILPAVAGG